MKCFGLLGRTLTHSYSKAYFEKKFSELSLEGYRYDNFEISSIGMFPALLADNPLLAGLNVTVPYKEAVIPYLDSLSGEASLIGAVNCISIDGGRTRGHNTDAYGFAQSIKPFLDNTHERALLLGTGGSARAVAFVLRRIGVDVWFVSRKGADERRNILSYDALNPNVLRAFRLLINCTPVGMFPATENFPPLAYEALGKEHLVYDLVYNPPETVFLEKARQQGAVTVNGLSMLHQQAEKSWRIWSGEE